MIKACVERICSKHGLKACVSKAMTIRKIHWSSLVCIENSNACCSVAELKTKQNTKTQMMMMMMKLMSDPIKS